MLILNMKIGRFPKIPLRRATAEGARWRGGPREGILVRKWVKAEPGWSRPGRPGQVQKVQAGWVCGGAVGWQVTYRFCRVLDPIR